MLYRTLDYILLNFLELGCIYSMIFLFQLHEYYLILKNKKYDPSFKLMLFLHFLQMPPPPQRVLSLLVEYGVKSTLLNPKSPTSLHESKI